MGKIKLNKFVLILVVFIVMFSGNAFGAEISVSWCGQCGCYDQTSCEDYCSYCGSMGSGQCTGYRGTSCPSSCKEINGQGWCYCTDNDGDEWCGGTGSAPFGDCNDADGAMCPDSAKCPDICNGKNDDCDAATADGSGEVTPPNSNQKGVCAGSERKCYGTAGWLDYYSDIVIQNYQQTETLCDGRDNDCDGNTDPGCECITGHTQQCGLTDVGRCEYGTQTCSAGAWGACSGDIPPTDEKCNNLDDNCDGSIDDGCDNDDDGYCDSTMSVVGMPPICPKGGNDCNSDDGSVHPGAAEICDSIDNNCNGQTDEGFDADNDGVSTCMGDCNDNPASGGASINPGATEICNGIDDNCNGQTDEGCDDDTDGYCDSAMALTGVVTKTGKICENEPDIAAAQIAFGTDCNDKRNNAHPGAPERCDAHDDNCDGNNNEGLSGCTWYYILQPITFNVTIPAGIDTKNIIAYTWDFGDGTEFGTMYPYEALPVIHTYTSVTRDENYFVTFWMMDKDFKIYKTFTEIDVGLQENDGICTKDSDCESGYCNPNAVCSTPGCSDSWKNQDETDVDCGGICVRQGKKCGLYKKCLVKSDCGTSYGYPLDCINHVCFYSPDEDGQPVGNIVFVTSDTYNGNLDGLTGADAKCRMLATAAGLTGTYKAWLSDSTTSAASRLTHSNMPYSLTTGVKVADNWNDLTDGSLDNVITTTEKKQGISPQSSLVAWTNTKKDGSIDSIAWNCGNWRASSQLSYGRYGAITKTDITWTEWNSKTCSIPARLYCFSQ